LGIIFPLTFYQYFFNTTSGYSLKTLFVVFPMSDNPKYRHRISKGDVSNFMKEVGDETVPNPNPKSRDTHPEVKVKSLTKTDEGKRVLERLMDKWKNRRKDSDPSEKAVSTFKAQKSKLDTKELYTFVSDAVTMGKVKGDFKKLPEAEQRKVLENLYAESIENVTKHYFEKAKNPKKKPSLKDLTEFNDMSRGPLLKVDNLDKYKKAARKIAAAFMARSANKNSKWDYAIRPEWVTTSGAYGSSGVYAEVKYTPKPTPDLRKQAIADFKKRAIPVGEATVKHFKARAKFDAGFPSDYGNFYTQAFWMKL